MVKRVRHFVDGAIGRRIPAKHVHYFGLVIRTYYWPTDLIKIGPLEASEIGAYHCTVYGVSKLNMVLGFPNVVLLSMADTRSRSSFLVV